MQLCARRLTVRVRSARRGRWNIRLRGNHVCEGSPPGKLSRRQGDSAAGAETVLDRTQPAPCGTWELDVLVDHQSGHSLLLMPAADVELLAAVDRITFLPRRFLGEPNQVADPIAIIHGERKSEIIGIAAIPCVQLPGHRRQAGIQPVVEQVAQPWTGRRSLRQAAAMRAKMHEQAGGRAVPADGPKIPVDPMGVRGRKKVLEIEPNDHGLTGVKRGSQWIGRVENPWPPDGTVTSAGHGEAGSAAAP